MSLMPEATFRIVISFFLLLLSLLRQADPILARQRPNNLANANGESARGATPRRVQPSPSLQCLEDVPNVSCTHE